MKVRSCSKVLMVLLLAGFAATCGFGQAVNNAQMHGRVTDPTGAAVVGAQVQAVEVATGLVRTTITNSEGEFSLPNLPVGPYKLEVTAAGFANYTQTGITLQVGQNVKLDPTLRVGSVTAVEEVVGVEAKGQEEVAALE